MEIKSPLNTISVKLPVTSRVNQSFLKWIYIVEKYANSRNVIYSVTNFAKMKG